MDPSAPVARASEASRSGSRVNKRRGALDDISNNPGSQRRRICSDEERQLYRGNDRDQRDLEIFEDEIDEDGGTNGNPAAPLTASARAEGQAPAGENLAAATEATGGSSVLPSVTSSADVNMEGEEEPESSGKVAEASEPRESTTGSIPAAEEQKAQERRNRFYFHEYSEDIYRYYRQLERDHWVPRTALGEVQNEITPAMRGILVDWLVEVSEEYRLTPETLYIAIAYIDRCLASFRVTRTDLQLLGCACILVASKFEEVYAPSVDEFVYISDYTYTKRQMLEMETKVLQHLKYRLIVATPKHFLRRFLKIAGANTKEKLFAYYMSELILQDHSYLEYLPSQRAAAAVLLAKVTLRRSPLWTPELQEETGYPMEDLTDCARKMADSHRLAERSTLQAVRTKFGQQRYASISRIIPPLPEDEVLFD